MGRELDLRGNGHDRDDLDLMGVGRLRVSLARQAGGQGSCPVPPGAHLSGTRTHMRHTWKHAALRA